MLMEQLFRADRARGPGAAQPQCARSRRRAAGDEPEGGVAGLSRPSPRGIAAPQPPPPGRGRAPHRDPARPDRRLPQSRRGDPHHPRGRRPEGRDDRALGTERGSGRGDPQHAAARVAPARRDRDPQGNGHAVGRGSAARRGCWKRARGNGARIAKEVRATAAEFGGDTALGRRRTALAEAPAVDRDPGRGADRARAGDGAVLGQGLGARGQGARHRGRGAEIQGRRRGRALPSPPRPPTG